MSVNVVTAPRASSLIYGIAQQSPKDQVWLLPANVCPAVPFSLLAADRPFEFIDLDPITYSLSVEQAIRRLQHPNAPHIAGILYVRSYGTDQFAKSDLARLRKAFGPDCFLLDDRCLGWPETDPESLLSTQADAALYSTGYSKYVDLGSGGYAFLRDDLDPNMARATYDAEAFNRLEARFKSALASGQMFPSDVPGVGKDLQRWLPNSPSPDWSSLKSQIDARRQKMRAHKSALNFIYSDGLPANIQWPTHLQSWRFNISVPHPASLIDHIFEGDLFASRHYAVTAKVFGGGAFSVADHLQGNVVNLFNDFHFDSDKAMRIVDIIQAYLHDGGPV